MIALAGYLIFILAAAGYAILDWRRGWYLVALAGVVQDPVRKLTPGTPVYISFLILAVYAAIIFAARRTLRHDLQELSHRFPRIYSTSVVFFFLLCLAGLNGLFSYGLDKWAVPLVSLITYSAPLLAVIFGYSWLRSEESLYRFFRFYVAVTSIAMIGSVAEYLRVQSPVLGLVAFEGDYIRHLPGIQVRLLSGIYRSPDIMALHAATATAICIAMALRSGIGRQMLLWGGAAAWAFLNCLLAGRRKAIYFVVVFLLVFVWRYAMRIRTTQLVAMVGVFLILGFVVKEIASGEKTSVYATSAVASREELAQRFEGGMLATFQQFGLMGAGLGTATQGVYHLLGGRSLGWQEGGIGKLAAEVGLPGIVTIIVLALLLLRVLLRLTAIEDVPGSSLFIRVLLFALSCATAASFIASAQAYTDAVLALMAGFYAGCLLATATLDERLTEPPPGTARVSTSAARA